MSAATYLPLPTYPVYTPDACLSDIGGAVLRYVMSEGTTGSLSTRELELADIEGKRAVCGYGKEPGPALAHIQAARDLITASLTRRHAEEAAASTAPVVVAPEPPTPAEMAVEQAAEMTREEKIALLLEELLREVGGQKRPDDRDPDDGMKARLKPVVPRLPSGAVGLQLQ